jgi:hypothetical protein
MLLVNNEKKNLVYSWLSKSDLCEKGIRGLSIRKELFGY